LAFTQARWDYSTEIVGLVVCAFSVLISPEATNIMKPNKGNEFEIGMETCLKMLYYNTPDETQENRGEGVLQSHSQTACKPASVPEI
jgi:hypothetical protein